jgi:outer membrane protein assembly factor BamB
LSIEDDSIIVCAYSRSGKGMVTSLSTDLQHENWKVEYDGPIKSTPVVDAKGLWVLVEDVVYALVPSTGEDQGIKAQLPSSSVAKPMIGKRKGEVVIVFASSDWEGGLILVDQHGRVSTHLESAIGPVHKDLAAMDASGIVVVVADSYGALHTVNLDTMELSSAKLSNYPLSPPLVLDDRRIIIGSYDGKLRCQEGIDTLWECACSGAIFAKPLALRDRSIVVCTTAGDVMRIENEKIVDGQYRLPAEIWSNPCHIPGGNVIVFGARDSRVHLISMDT